MTLEKCLQSNYNYIGKSILWKEVQLTWSRMSVIAQSAVGCVSLSKLRNLSVLRLSHLYNRDVGGCPELIPRKP